MNKDNKSIKKIANYLVPIALGIVILFSGYKLVQSLLSYKIANDEYSQLQEYVEVTENPVSQKDNTTTEENAPNGVEEEISFPIFDVDYEALREINEDYMGWISIPALELSYPYVKGKDNEEYLHKTFDGTHSSSGAVFMDSFNYPNFRDFNTFIYAHNMKDKSMFGSLKLLAQNDELLKNEPYIYVYTPKASYQFLVFAYYVTRKGSTTYSFLLKPEEYDRYLEYISTVNQFTLEKNEINFSEYPRLLTLSTCQGGAGTSNRFVVHAVLINRIEREN